MSPRRLATMLLCLQGSVLCGTAAATEPVDAAMLPVDLTELSLDALLGIEVTSVSRRAEPITDAAAAVFVVTAEEIRRLGATTIAEALRVVPGLHVTRNDALSYTVTSRGLGVDKLEVRLDGRSVYSPFTSTVFWDTLDTYLPDIERIEVIRGPGAALWGANAVNGVINIITRSAAATRGIQVVAGAGTEEKASAAVRVGAKVGDAGDVRFHAKARERDASRTPDGEPGGDSGSFAQVGFRADLGTDAEDARRNHVLLSADYHHGSGHGPDGLGSFVPLRVSGQNFVARWERSLGTGSELAVMAYYDHSHRVQDTVYSEQRDTVDVDAQHRVRLGASNELLYGVGYRRTSDRFGEAPEFAIITSPAQRANRTWSLYLQDQQALHGGDGMVTLGTRFEHNDITGLEVQPNLRVGWRLHEQLFSWAMIGRAVRMPNRYDTSVALYCPPPDGIPDTCPAGVIPLGSTRIKSETVLAYEAGLRFWAARKFSADLALFYDTHRRLISQEPDAPLDAIFANKLEADSFGGELAVTWQPATVIQVNASYGYLAVNARTTNGGNDTYGLSSLEGGSPRHQASLRATWQIAPAWTASGFLRYVGAIPDFAISGYTELNARVAWRARPNVELAVIGDNLLHPQHAEDGSYIDLSGAGTPREMERAARVELTWNW